MRTCTKCGESKGLEAFARAASSRDGRRAECKACVNRRQAISRNAVGFRGRRGRVPVGVLRELRQ